MVPKLTDKCQIINQSLHINRLAEMPIESSILSDTCVALHGNAWKLLQKQLSPNQPKQTNSSE